MFRIPYASLQDEGEYTCTASNIAGDDSETVHLYVRSKMLCTYFCFNTFLILIFSLLLIRAEDNV